MLASPTSLTSIVLGEAAFEEAYRRFGVEPYAQGEAPSGFQQDFWRTTSDDWRRRMSPPPARLRLTPETSRQEWAQLAIGQGPIDVTPIHMTRFISAIGNGGVMVDPTIESAFTGEAPEGRRIMSEETAARLLAAMTRVVDEGTARSTAPVLEGLDWDLAGKTGTAQVAGTADNGWFAGLMLDAVGAAIAVGRFPGRQALIVALNAFMGLPPVVVGLLVYLMLSRAGPLGQFGMLFTPAAMIVAQTILIVPIIAALSRQVLEDAWQEYREQLRSLRSLARVDYAGPDGKGNVQEAVLVQRPDRLRLETLTFLGAVLIVTVDNNEIVGYHPREGIFVRGERTKENLLRYTQIPLELSEITSLLMGLAPVDAAKSVGPQIACR